MAELDAETARLAAAVEQAQIELTQLEIEQHRTSEAQSARAAMRRRDRADANQV
jgi:hypothetical protein